jgi:hypothetical protein
VLSAKDNVASDKLTNVWHTTCADSAHIPQINERTHNGKPGDAGSVTQSDVYNSAQLNEQFCGGAISRPSHSSDVRNTVDKPACWEILNIGWSSAVMSFRMQSDNDFQPLGSRLRYAAAIANASGSPALVYNLRSKGHMVLVLAAVLLQLQVSQE